MMLLHTDSNRATWCSRTVSFQGTRSAIFHGKLDLDHLIVTTVNGWGPAQTLPPGWACRLLRLPINLETPGIKALSLFCLPLVICPRRRDETNPILATA